MVPLWLKGAVRLGAVTAFGGGKFGHEYAKCRSSGLRLAFDNAAVITDNFGDKREPQTRP